MAVKTRSSQHNWLIGFPSDKINGAKLPSGRDVMHCLSNIAKISAQYGKANIQPMMNRLRYGTSAGFK